MSTDPYGTVFLFAVLPYVALFLFFVVSVERYRDAPFSYSSLSSQFLENQQHFWSLVPFHYGLLVILGAHIMGLFIPRQVLLWNMAPLRLYVLEITGLVFALLALIGLITGLVRRWTYSKLRIVTTWVDWVMYALLAIQILSGVFVAIFHPWGSSWYAATAVPYLWSIVKFAPDISYVSAMPIAVKIHIINAFCLVGFFPFTRLVHVLVVPNPYLWRKPQVVRWYWNRRTIRSATQEARL